MRPVAALLTIFCACSVSMPLYAWECKEDELAKLKAEEFKKMDADKDGAVTTKEYTEATPFTYRTTGYNTSKEKARSDFNRHLAKHVKKNDADHDGKLTPEEFALHRKPEC